MQPTKNRKLEIKPELSPLKHYFLQSEPGKEQA